MKILIMLLALFPLVAFSEIDLKMFVGKEYKENGGVVYLNKGDILVVFLETQLSTGYDWKLKNSSPENVKLIETAIFYKEQKKEIVGGEELRMFKFSVKGEATLRFIYKRAWEKSFLKEKVLKVLIKKEGE